MQKNVKLIALELLWEQATPAERRQMAAFILAQVRQLKTVPCGSGLAFPRSVSPRPREYSQ